VDIRNLLPCDANVNGARGNKFFGECTGPCTTPAHPEATADTSTDALAWLPPVSLRGDVARILFYMELRYDGDEPDVEDLVLSDAPGEFGMGYLSRLIAWHAEDPVDDVERQRNDDICATWQGNRNPFVDYPYLVPSYFAATPSPPTPSPAGCDLAPGDVAITGISADDPDVIAMVALRDIPPGTRLFATDNAWNGLAFQDNEGVETLLLPQGIPSGTVFGYGSPRLPFNDAWTTQEDGFLLSTRGDNIFVYCRAADGLRPLAGLIYNSPGWTDRPPFSSSGSALPSGLDSGLSLPLSRSAVYRGRTQGTREELSGSLSDPDNWLSTDDPGFDVVDLTSFEVEVLG